MGVGWAALAVALVPPVGGGKAAADPPAGTLVSGGAGGVERVMFGSDTSGTDVETEPTFGKVGALGSRDDALVTPVGGGSVDGDVAECT